MRSMNRVCLVGRLTKDLEMRDSANTAVARFTVAVQSQFKNENGEFEADFISCVAFGKTAEFMGKYLYEKGQAIGLTGRIQTGSYTDQDGNKHYTTDVIAENVEFVERKHVEDTGTRRSSRRRK